MKFKLLATCVILTACTMAQATPVQGVTLSGGRSFANDGPWTLGYRFTAINNIAVTALGAFDLNGDGFLNSHAVGIWSVGGTLLASTTVTSADALVGDFRYGSISSLGLSAGTDYIVAAADFGGDNQDTYWLDAAVTSAPDVAYVSAQFIKTAGLSYAAYQGTSGGYFGGNFLYEGGTVPEPASLALAGFALAGLCAARKRSQKQ